MGTPFVSCSWAAAVSILTPRSQLVNSTGRAVHGRVKRLTTNRASDAVPSLGFRRARGGDHESDPLHLPPARRRIRLAALSRTPRAAAWFTHPSEGASRCPMEPWPLSAGPTSSRRPSQPMPSAASSPLVSSRSTAAGISCAASGTSGSRTRVDGCGTTSSGARCLRSATGSPCATQPAAAPPSRRFSRGTRRSRARRRGSRPRSTSWWRTSTPSCSSPASTATSIPGASSAISPPRGTAAPTRCSC